MRLNTFYYIIASIILFSSCKDENPARIIIQQTIDHYFPSGLDNKMISFDFRGRSYTATRYPDKFIYTRAFEDSVGYVKDILVNSSEFVRTVDHDTIEVSNEWSKKYTASVNAVLYFFQIPYVLNDPAVNTQLMGEEKIKNETYWMIKVTFDQKSGGEGYEDQFLYWIHQNSHAIDYMAYNYAEDGGGVRFRESINRRKVEGLIFQDYINYEVRIGTPLETIPALFEARKLKELSRIINENITVSQAP